MSRWKDRRRIAMLQCNVQTRTCSPRRSVIAGMAVLASQLGKLWTLCPVDVEEDGGEGEMVRGEEPFWRRTKAKAGGASMHVHACECPCRFAGACGACESSVTVCLGGGCGSEWMDPARCVHTCCRSPRNFISQDWIRPGLAKVQGVRDWQDKQAEIERAKPKPREGVSVVQGPLSVSLTLTLAVSVPIASSIHTIRAQIPPHTSFARFGGASGAR